jgi:hypothetical protein
MLSKSSKANKRLIKIGDTVDSDPLVEYEVIPDPTYADTDPEAGVLPPE